MFKEEICLLTSRASICNLRNTLDLSHNLYKSYIFDELCHLI